MSVFDQRGQKVNYQYNAAGNINFGSVQNRSEVITNLEKLHDEVTKAISTNQLNEDAGIDAEFHVKKALQQAKKDTPDKKTIIDHLSKLKGLIAGVTSLVGLVKGVSEAIEAVKVFFL